MHIYLTCMIIKTHYFFHLIKKVVFFLKVHFELCIFRVVNDMDTLSKYIDRH
jgi:hypothetical protein